MISPDLYEPASFVMTPAGFLVPIFVNGNVVNNFRLIMTQFTCFDNSNLPFLMPLQKVQVMVMSVNTILTVLCLTINVRTGYVFRQNHKLHKFTKKSYHELVLFGK